MQLHTIFKHKGRSFDGQLSVYLLETPRQYHPSSFLKIKLIGYCGVNFNSNLLADITESAPEEMY